ncbi:MAG: MOSC domain-containing protein [Pirellulales bacterium]
MQVVAVNVAEPRDVEWNGQTVRTSIFKLPVPGKVAVRKLNLEGDAQADLTVHGGPDKAIYAYAMEHYRHWESRLERTLSPAAFGENLTTEGLFEDRVHIGDEFQVGTARLVATQCRLPCYKLGIRFADPGMVRLFLKSRRPGIYFAVVEEGEVGPGDAIELVRSDERRVTVSEMLAIVLDRKTPADDLRRLLDVPALASVWREELESRLTNDS